MTESTCRRDASGSICQEHGAFFFRSSGVCEYVRDAQEAEERRRNKTAGNTQTWHRSRGR